MTSEVGPLGSPVQNRAVEGEMAAADDSPSLKPQPGNSSDTEPSSEPRVGRLESPVQNRAIEGEMVAADDNPSLKPQPGNSSDAEPSSEPSSDPTQPSPVPAGHGQTQERGPKKMFLNMFKGALPESVRKIWKSGTSISSEELSEDDVIIALMGPTGAGKSSFIKKATGFDSRIGHELQSCTTEIGIIRVQCVERSHFDVVFVDTPGFDDTNKSDGEILEMIAQWLNTTYERNITLSGILYLHRISDNRMAGTPLKNLRIFKKLCGKNALQNIILTTTMWDDVNRREGLEREKDLKENYWKVMLKQKSTVARYDNTTESAWQVVEPLLREANKRSALRLQQEMVELKRELPETKAGGELYTRLEVAFRKQQDTLERIRMETKRAENDRVLDDLKAEYDELRKKAEVIIADMQALKVPLGRRFVRILTSGLGIMRILPGGHLHGHH